MNTKTFFEQISLDEIEGIKIAYHTINMEYANEKTPTIYIHGFSGSAKEWRDYAFSSLDFKSPQIYLDLPGYGESDVPELGKYYSPQFFNSLLNNFTAKLNIQRFNLAGYSMGGRYALNYALENSSKLNKLILVSSGYGIIKKENKDERRKQDERLAKMIEESGINKFIDYWMALPLFAGLQNISPARRDYIIGVKNRNSKMGLINSLMHFGQGTMDCLQSKLSNLKMPVLVIVGINDAKYSQIADVMRLLIPDSKKVAIERAGHSVHEEKPDEVATVINNFLH